MNHGVSVLQKTTSIGVPSVATVGIPFFIGTSPAHSADSPAPVGEPVLCTSWDEAVDKLGYSDDWQSYNLCECMYSHFVLYQKQPAVFCNLLDINTSQSVPASVLPIVEHRVLLPLEALNDDTLIIKPSAGGNPYIKDSDYAAYYSGERLIVEFLQGGGAYDAIEANIEYKTISPASVTPEIIATGLQNIDKCPTSVGVLPDLIVAPGYSGNPVVGAVMAAKADGISGLFKAKALIDLSTDPSGGALTYTDAITLKGVNNFNDRTQIICWPMVKLGDKTFHMSTQLAGLIATVDAGNQGIPYESPSNKELKCNAVVLKDGSEPGLTHAQANNLNANGITTALNFMGSLVCWGNYTACYPKNTDPKDFFIPMSRMFDWVGNTAIRTFWSKLDKPMNQRMVESIADTCNIWLNGLVGDYLLGARIEVRGDENPSTDIMGGIIRLHIYMTPPPPMQEAVFILELDPDYLATLL